MIKLIAIDLDGTLLNSEKQVSEENKQAITAAKAKGVKVMLCTGRPLKSVLPLLEELGLMDEGDYSITLNGGLIQSNHDGEVLSETLLNGTHVKDIYQLSQSLDLTLDVVSRGTVYRATPVSNNHPSIYHQVNKVLAFKEKRIEEFSESDKVNKMVCTDVNPEYLTQQMKTIPSEYFERYNIVRSGANLFEFVDKTVSKAAGMAQLGDILNISPSEMMALGDEENDFSMIDYAGIGVAMGNATDQIKQIAQFETKTNDEHGVAYAINKFVLEA
ncbi:Cof-type HAD-IIB family hydrolase [Vagococcus xieshaowenii]|uniref:HAD family phosphatase n=1 Tax=Vagococcus xieshaowenii TaxID=2562451 RepID=A0AAJ5EEJ8_9ENTE|nr:Cof-type HAD-IIB family hydrolase [Vagococcus xieshaowenii]QCA28273.1 HAD family phosphatase [Vagococcus xieshaowenii]TFZ41928.1 HAD family phosphatase [Vagococcus xieshaowenii]